MTYDHISPPEPANDNDIEPMVPLDHLEVLVDIGGDIAEEREVVPPVDNAALPVGEGKRPSRQRKAKPARPRSDSLPDAARDALNLAKLQELIDRMPDLAAACFAEADREYEPGPRAKLISAGAALSRHYAKLLKEEQDLRDRLRRVR